MRRILVAVRDGSEASRIEDAIAGQFGTKDLHVVLLSAQPKPVTWQTRGLQREAIKERLIERGRATCQPLADQLRRSGIAYHIHVELEDEETAITRCAAFEQCSGVVILSDRPGWANRMLGRISRMLGTGLAERVHIRTSLPTLVAS